MQRSDLDPKLRVAALSLGAGLALAACASTPGPKPSAVAGRAAVVCTETRFPLYFQPNSDQMTAEQGKVIAAYAQRVRGCDVAKLDVVGLAGLEGNRADALELAQRRAVVVAAALKAAGLPTPRVDMGAVGSEGARTKAGRRIPMRRRAEVIIYAGAPPTATR